MNRTLRMTNHSTPQVKIRRRGDGWTYQLFTSANDPLQFEGDNETHATQQEAEGAGYEALRAFMRRLGSA